jgi:hypothetical protein
LKDFVDFKRSGCVELAAVIVTGFCLCTVSWRGIDKISRCESLPLKATARGCIADPFLDTFCPDFRGLRELDPDLKLCSFSAGASSTDNFGVLRAGCGVRYGLVIFCGCDLKIAATETDFCTATGEACLMGGCTLRRARRMGLGRPTSMLLVRKQWCQELKCGKVLSQVKRKRCLGFRDLPAPVRKARWVRGVNTM